MKNVLKKNGFTHSPTTKQLVRGFTLIESMIYCALLAILLTTLFQASRMALTAQWTLSDNLALANDGFFVDQKIHWLLQNVSRVSTSQNQLRIESIDNRTTIVMMENNDLVLLREGIKSTLVSDVVRTFSVSQNTDQIMVGFKLLETDFSTSYASPSH